MSRLGGKLVIDAAIHHDYSIARNCIPSHFVDSGVVVGSEPTMSDGLSCKDGHATFFMRLSISVADVIGDGISRSPANLQNCSGGFWFNRESWKMSGIFDREFQGNCIYPFIRENWFRIRRVISDGGGTLDEASRRHPIYSGTPADPLFLTH
jgi:hypothetical protein